MLELNTKVKMMTNNHSSWNKGDTGRISNIMHDGYIICFDSLCHIRHSGTGGHAWWALPSSVEPIELPKKLMTVE